MRRMLAVLGVAATFAIGQTALAAPAGAKVNCTFEGFTQECRGGSGEGEGGAGGGAGRHDYYDALTGSFTNSGGGGFGGGPGFGQDGGGFGEHCTSDGISQRCVGGGSAN